jgi:GxxExxY protein
MGLIFEKETYAIRGAAMEVYKSMGAGFLEGVYQECLELEFQRRGIPFESQKALPLEYSGVPLKHVYRPDFVCFGKVIVEIKAVSTVCHEHRAQLTNYLAGTGMQLGLLFNFGHYPLLEQVRIANIYNPGSIP